MMLRLLTTLSLCLIFLTGYSQFETVGIIGSATPEEWNASTPMEQDETNPDIWRLTIELADGEAKFRADNDWVVNWGDTAFPIGTGSQGGPNIPVIGGNYAITFNSATGEYFFDYLDSDIGIIGSATPFELSREVFMFRDADDANLYYVTLDLVAGEAKFRADGDWTLNWGGLEFPEGDAIEGGDNIIIPQTGTYYITFDRTALRYSFEELVDYETIGLIGSATPGDWAEDTPMNRDPNDPDLWLATIDLIEGELKFRANNDWGVNWGGPSFPSGTGVPGGDNIAVDQAGTYMASFNTSTLEYNFILIIEYPQMGIIGSATPNGWGDITEMARDADDVSLWSLRAVLTTGDLLFSTDNTLATAWGGATFPSGTAIPDASVPIPVEEGEYRITFNSTTGAYNFIEIIEYGAVSIVGKSGPFLAWPEPDDEGAVDYFLDKDPDDGNIWRGYNVALIDYDAASDGGLKFRADTAWAVNWGSVDFPGGVGTQNGMNIQPVGGNYDVVFNSATGEYLFTLTVSVKNQAAGPDAIALMPNPASSELNILLDNQFFSGPVNVSILDISGKNVMTRNFYTSENMNLQVSNLPAGSYLVHIYNDKFFASKKLLISK